MNQRILDALDAAPDRSPLLVIDLDVVAERYASLAVALPTSTIYYAMKANPHPEVLKLLAAAGSSFDVASIGEVHDCLAVGIEPTRLSFGNTVKKASAIAEAHALGVRRFAFDAESELAKLVEHAPGSTAFCRILCDGLGAAWPLSRKFGCSVELAGDLLRRAHEGGLVPGVSFHVGSQQFDPEAWDRALALVADLRAELRSDGVELGLVNLGGGFPGTYLEEVPPTAAYGEAITAALERRLGPELPAEILVEPGRYLVADSGVLRAEVVTVGRKAAHDEHRWVYLDVGMFSGLAEVMDEAIRYRIQPAVDGRADGPTGPVVLAGPTCDSADILYQTVDYQLPLDLAPGDRLHLMSVGAYSITYSTIGFNGFPPLDVEVLAASGSAPVTDGPGLPEALVDVLRAEGIARSYPAGAMLFAEGDPPGPTLLVVSGEVDIQLGDGSVLATASAGNLVGDLSSVDAQPRSASAVARTDVEVRAIAPLRFTELIDEHPELCRHLLRVLVARLRRSTVARAPAGLGIPVDRLSAWILDRRGEDDWIDLSLDEVAREVGASRELLLRAIDHLVGQGAVALERGRLLVRSEEALAALAGR